MERNLMYLAASKEQFERLEAKLNRFAEKFHLVYEGRICVGAGPLDVNGIHIFPDTYGKIHEVSNRNQDKEIFTEEQETSGKLIRSTSLLTVLEIDDTKYTIQYEPIK